MSPLRATVKCRKIRIFRFSPDQYNKRRDRERFNIERVLTSINEYQSVSTEYLRVFIELRDEQ